MLFFIFFHLDLNVIFFLGLWIFSRIYFFQFPGGPSVHRKRVHRAHVHENGFLRPQGAFTYTPPFSRPYRGFHDFHVFSRTFMVFSRPFAHIFTYIFWFSRPSPVFTPTPCFRVHTAIFEFIWPNGLWTQRARVQAHIECASLKPNMLHCCPIDIQEALWSPCSDIGAGLAPSNSVPSRDFP